MICHVLRLPMTARPSGVGWGAGAWCVDMMPVWQSPVIILLLSTE
jgi:hypothetical protein